MKTLFALAALAAAPALAQHQPPQPPPVPKMFDANDRAASAADRAASMALGVPQVPMPPEPPPPFFHGPPGIPPQVAAKLGIPTETVKKVKELSFDAQETLINLEADLKRSQLELERALAQAAPDESAVNLKLESVSKAELAVRKNRLGLMLKIRKLLGSEMWDRLQAELPMMDAMGAPHGYRREIRVIRGPNGEKTTEVNESP